MATFWSTFQTGLKVLFEPEMMKVVEKGRTMPYHEYVVHHNAHPDANPHMSAEQFKTNQDIINKRFEAPAAKIVLAEKKLVEGGVTIITKLVETEAKATETAAKAIDVTKDALDKTNFLLDNIYLVGGVVLGVLFLLR